MGWTSTTAIYYTENGKVDRKAECDNLYTWETETHKNEVIKSSMRGSVYYAAVRITNKTTGSTEVWAGVCLTSTKPDGGFNFGYKEMSEDCGPCESNCPKSILVLLTDTENEYAKEWRERCWANLKNNKSLASVKIGEIIEFERGGETIRAEKMAPAYQFKTPWFKCVGKNAYIKKNHIKDWRIVPEDAATATETAQISTETTEAVKCTTEGETTQKTANIGRATEGREAKCRLAPQWAAKKILKYGYTLLCFNLYPNGDFSVSVENKSGCRILTKDEFRKLCTESPQTANYAVPTPKRRQRPRKRPHQQFKQYPQPCTK